MSIANKKYSPTKIPTQIQQPINPQYLNFIRKNHLQFQRLERSNSKLLLESDRKVVDEERMKSEDFFNNGDKRYINSARKQIVGIAEENKQRVLIRNDDLSPDEKELIKNYKTIDVIQQNSYQKYLNLGQTTIVPIKKSSNHHKKQQNDLNQQQQQQNIQSSRVKSSIEEMKKQLKQKYLSNDQKSSQTNQTSINQDRNHFSTQTQKMMTYDKKAASEIKFVKTNNDHHHQQQNNRSPLLMKKQLTRDLWKQKFLNWNYGNISAFNRKTQKKNIQTDKDIKFPSINITKMENNNNRDRVKSNTQDVGKAKKKDQLYQLNDCNLIRNSKPKPNKQYQQQVYLQNSSLGVIPRSQDEVNEFIKKHIESGLLKRQSSIRNYQSNNKRNQENHSQLSSSMLHSNPSSVSVMKRKRNATTHKPTGIVQINMSSNLRQLQCQTQQKKKPKNYKQIARQKQKQVEDYLLNNSLLKSSKIVNFYQKQQEKNKLAFDKKHQSQMNIVREANISLIQRGGSYTKRKQNDNEKNLLQREIPDSQDDGLTDIPMTENHQGLNFQHSTNVIGTSPLSLQKKKGPNINTLKRQYDLSIYQLKIRSYREFIFMMNLAHKLVINIGLKPASQAKGLKKYTYFIGNGNNRLLIKSLMNRRYWWQETKDMNKGNFVWTQLKVNDLYRYEKVSEYAGMQNRFDKLQNVEENKLKKEMKKKNMIKNQSKITSYKAPLPENHELKIFTKSDKLIYDNMIESISDNPDNVININLNQRLKFLPTEKLTIEISEETLHQQKLHNHLEFNYFIGNKKALFYNLQNYYNLLGKDVFKIIPYTLHIKKGVQDQAYKTFLKEYKRVAKDQQKTGMKNIWIVKPGQLSNRGQGITVIDQVYELNNILKKKQKHKNGIEKSYILQKYIQKPLLYKNRKFDIRHYVLLTRFHGRFRAYFYGQGYIRTSSHEFKLDELDEMIHLTNDAIQNKGQSYGKHEDGNKVSYSQFQRYLDSTYGENKHNFAQDLYPKMKNIALDAIKATYAQLDPSRLEHNFELLGLDFMIDNKFNLWLIQVNTNPCLELSSKLLERLIPQMAEHTLRLCIDPMFPPPAHFPNSLKHLCPDSPLQRMQYELIFDQARDGQQLQQLFKKCNLKQLYKDMGEVDQQDATFENDGREIEFKNQKGEDNQ